MKKAVILGLSCSVLVAATVAWANARVGDPYTLPNCPVSGEKLGSMGEAPVLIGEDGREVRLCCAGCEKKYKDNAEAMNAEIDKKIMADQEGYYPAATCINSGAELKEGGVAFVAGNRLMKTCCNNCKAKVMADPASFIAKLDKQVSDAQRDGYKAEACPISGKAIGDAPVEVVVASRLVKLCCAGCTSKVDADPLGVIEKIDAAN